MMVEEWDAIVGHCRAVVAANGSLTDFNYPIHKTKVNSRINYLAEKIWQFFVALLQQRNDLPNTFL